MAAETRSLHDVDTSSPAAQEMGSGERHLRVLVASAGYRTVRAAAAAAGVHRTTLIEAARGTKAPTRSVVERCATALRIDPDVLARIFSDARTDRRRS
jgi:hypothetical protein